MTPIDNGPAGQSITGLGELPFDHLGTLASGSCVEPRTAFVYARQRSFDTCKKLGAQ